MPAVASLSGRAPEHSDQNPQINCFHFRYDPQETLRVLLFRKRLAFPWINVKNTYEMPRIINRKAPSSSPGCSLTLPQGLHHLGVIQTQIQTLARTGNQLCNLGIYKKISEPQFLTCKMNNTVTPLSTVIWREEMKCLAPPVPHQGSFNEC